MAANGGRHFEIKIKPENNGTQFISEKHAYTFDKLDLSNYFMGLFLILYVSEALLEKIISTVS